MNIKEILLTPAGSKVGGFTATIKTAKKCWKVGDTNWQCVMFMDSTGEILADVNLGLKYIPLRQSTKLEIREADIQLTDLPNKLSMSATRHKLVIHKWLLVPELGSVWQDDDAESWAIMRDNEISGKCRYGLTAVWIGAVKRLAITPGEKQLINDLVEFVKHG